MSLNKTDSEIFTVDAVKSGDTDVLAVMVKNVKSKISAGKRSDDNLRIAAAYTTIMAARTEEDFKDSAFAKRLDTARANVYLWRRLGAAVVDLGVEPESDDWAMLSAVANRAPVSWALDGLDFDTIRIDANGKPTIKTDSGTGVVDRDRLDEVLGYLYPDGYRDEESGQVNRPLPAEKVNAKMIAAYGSEVEQADAEAAAEAERAKRVAESVRYLTDNLDKITPETWGKVEEKFGDMLKVASATRRRAAEAAKNAA